MHARKTLVTHHAPDLDAITGVWLFKRFDSEHFADAHVMFVNPGAVLDSFTIEQNNLNPAEVVHVDTGLGEFDHHQTQRGNQMVCATTLIFDYLVKHYKDLVDDQALIHLVSYVNDIDHFQEINWPETSEFRFNFMIQELIHGMELTTPRTDESQLYFGMQCLDSAYAALNQYFKALTIIEQNGQPFTLAGQKALALQTSNDEVLKLAQKQGYALVVRKDPNLGNIRIKARPDSDIVLDQAAQTIKAVDQVGHWYYHPSGKMLLNGSDKHQNQAASPLTLDQVIEILQKTYGS